MAKNKKAVAPKPSQPPLRLEWRDPAELADNPANWREHPEAQTVALQDVIGEVGWAGALLYNERTGRLIDGHARKKVAKGPVPVLIGSWSEADEKKILATLDPLAGLAEANAEALAALLGDVTTGSEAVKAMLAGLAQPETALKEPVVAPQMEMMEYRVIVRCDNEEHQREILAKLENEGMTCQALIS